MQQSNEFNRINADFQLVRSQPGPFGLVRLRLGGATVGLLDEPTFLFPLLETLEGLGHQQPGRSDPAEVIYKLQTKDAWNYVSTAGEEYVFPPLELFDNELMFYAKDDRNIRILWKSRLDLEEVPKDVLIPLSEVRAVAGDLRRVYDSIRASGAGLN